VASADISGAPKDERVGLPR